MYKTKWTQLEKNKAIKVAEECINDSIANIEKKFKEKLQKSDFITRIGSSYYMKVYVYCKKKKYVDYAEIVAINENGKVERYPAD